MLITGLVSANVSPFFPQRRCWRFVGENPLRWRRAIREFQTFDRRVRVEASKTGDLYVSKAPRLRVGTNFRRRRQYQIKIVAAEVVYMEMICFDDIAG